MELVKQKIKRIRERKEEISREVDGDIGSRKTRTRTRVINCEKRHMGWIEMKKTVTVSQQEIKVEDR